MLWCVWSLASRIAVVISTGAVTWLHGMGLLVVLLLLLRGRVVRPGAVR